MVEQYVEEHTVLTKQQDEDLTDLAGTYSDLYKDLYGFRPRGYYPSTIEEYRKEVDKISKQLCMEIELERKRKNRIKHKKPYVSKPINYPFKALKGAIYGNDV